MQNFRVTERTGKDGILHVRIPMGVPEEDFEVVVVVQPKPSNTPTTTPEELGWPPGHFDLAGSIDDETFIRHPQGELPKPVEFE